MNLSNFSKHMNLDKKDSRNSETAHSLRLDILKSHNMFSADLNSSDHRTIFSDNATY